MALAQDSPRYLNQQVRDELRKRLATDAELDAFCMDYFREVQQLFSGGMDRLMKENLLLQKASPKHILKALIGSRDMRSENDEPRSTKTWMSLAKTLQLPDPIAVDLTKYDTELDMLVRAWDTNHPTRNAESAWIGEHWAVDVARWLVRLAGNESHCPALSREEWVVLLSAPLFVSAEIERTVPSPEQALSAILDAGASVAWPDAERQCAFRDFLSTHEPLVERAQRIAASSASKPLAAQEKLGAITDWLRYRFARKIRASWDPLRMLLFEKTEGKVSIAQLLAGRAFHRPDVRDRASFWHGRLLRIGCMNGQEIHSWLSETDMRNGAVVFDDRRIRFPLLATLLLLAEHLAVRPIDLSEAILHHIDMDPDLTPAAVCEEVRQRVDVDLAVPSRQIVIRARCRFNVVDFALNEIAQELDALLRGDLRRLQDRLDVGYFLPPTCVADVESAEDKATGRVYYRKPHLSFSLDADAVRAILMGTQLWEKRELAYRELYQNALDACRYRRCRSSYRGVAYEPKIRFHEGWDESGRYFVECEDNGIGMDMNLLSNCFARAGSRFRDSGSFTQERREWEHAQIPDLMYPNSQFGIGVFSYFLVADEIEVETCRLRSDAVGTECRYRVRIPAAASVFTIDEIVDTAALSGYYHRQSERKEPIRSEHRPGAGSRIRLYLTKQLHPNRDPDQVHRAQRFERCIDTLERLVWFTDVSMVATAYNRAEPSVWEPRKLAPRVAQYVEPVQGLGETQHFWVLKPGLVSKSSSNQQYVPLAGLDYSNDLDLEEWDGPLGCVLADGIATDHVVPCAIVNLWRDEQPTLSVDRQRIRHYSAERVRARFADPGRLRARPSGEPADGRWLHSLFEAWPDVCQRLVMERARAGKTWTYHASFLLDSERWTATFADNGFCPADTAILSDSAKELFLTGAPPLPPSMLLLAVWRCFIWEFPSRPSRQTSKLVLDPLLHVPAKHRLAMRSHGAMRMNHDDGKLRRALDIRWIDAEVQQKWRDTVLTPLESYFITELKPRVPGVLVAEQEQLDRTTSLFTKLSLCLSREGAKKWITPTLAALMRTLANFKNTDLPRSSFLARLDRLLEILDEAKLPSLGTSPDMLPLVSPEDMNLLDSIENRTIGPDLLAAKWRANQKLPALVDRLTELATAYGIPAPTIPVESLDALPPLDAEDWSLLSARGDGRPPWHSRDEHSFFRIVNMLLEMNMSDAAGDAKLEKLALIFGWVISLPAPESRAILEMLSADDRKLLSCSFDGRRPWIMDHGSVGEHAVAAALHLGQSVATCAARLNALAPALGWKVPPFSSDSLAVLETLSAEDLVLLGYSSNTSCAISTSIRMGGVRGHVYRAARRLGQPVAKCSERLQTLAPALGLQISCRVEELRWPTWLEESEQLEYLFNGPDEAWQSPGAWLRLAGQVRRPAHEVLAVWNWLREQLGIKKPPADIEALKALEPITRADFQLFDWTMSFSPGPPQSLQQLAMKLLVSRSRWPEQRSPLVELIALAFFTRDHSGAPREYPGWEDVYRRYIRYDTIATAIGCPRVDPQSHLQHQELARLTAVECTLLLTLAVWGEVTTDGSVNLEETAARRAQCGRFVALAALIHRPLYWIDERLRRWQPIFGTEPVNNDAVYLGLRWDTLVTRSRRDHPGFDQKD